MIFAVKTVLLVAWIKHNLFAISDWKFIMLVRFRQDRMNK
jgi:hypothetical protein